MKRCTKCKIKKPESKFYPNKKSPDGLETQCKECRKVNNDKRKHLKRNWQLEDRYGFLPGVFEKISKSQNNKCLICKREKKLVIDHCHKTNKVRGLLCNNCNTKLGWYENNSIQEYLNKPKWKFLLGWLLPRNKRDSYIRREFGICLDDYEMMLKSQNGVCWICHKTSATGSGLCIDHDHQTLIVRGLLCHHCNLYLGWYDKHPVQEYLND